MTITRIWQAGFEIGHINELDVYPNTDFGNTDMTISTTKSKTSARSMRGTLSSNYPRGKACSTTQIRNGFYINHQALTNNGQGVLAVIRTSFATASIVYWDEATNELRLRVNGSTVDSVDVAAAGFTNLDTWYHIGVTYKADAASGFFSVYIDGVQVLTYSGNTGTTISGVYVLGGLTGSAWVANAYIDDWYLDDAVGESDAAPSSLRFLFGIVNGAGASSGLSVNTGTQAGALDEIPPNDDTDYVYGTSSGLKSSYACTDITIPADHTVRAVVGVIWGRKTDAGAASTWEVGLRASGGTEVLGSAQTLSTAYGPYFTRQTDEPGGSGWDETKVNGAEIVLQTAGSY